MVQSNPDFQDLVHPGCVMRRMIFGLQFVFSFETLRRSTQHVFAEVPVDLVHGFHNGCIFLLVRDIEKTGLQHRFRHYIHHRHTAFLILKTWFKNQLEPLQRPLNNLASMIGSPLEFQIDGTPVLRLVGFMRTRLNKNLQPSTACFIRPQFGGTGRRMIGYRFGEPCFISYTGAERARRTDIFSGCLFSDSLSAGHVSVAPG